MTSDYGNEFVGPQPCDNCDEVGPVEWHDGWICERCANAVANALGDAAAKRRGEDAELYSGPGVDPDEILSVYVILNGSLGMGRGKSAAMAFHCGWYVGSTMIGRYMNDWERQGRRVVTRVAETEHVFNRVKNECVGHLQCDEGLTEVAHGAEVAFVTWPYRRDEAPAILTHKRCQLYRG